MSLRDEKIKSLLGLNLESLSENELKELGSEILESKVHGICFSLYEDAQQPGDFVSDEQIERRLKIQMKDMFPYNFDVIIIRDERSI